MYALHRLFEEALDEGVTTLDDGYEQLETGDYEDALESAERARRLFSRASVLARFLGSDDRTVDDEIERVRRLAELVSGDIPAPDSPASALQLFDEQIATGDQALRDDDIAAAQVGYVTAYSVLRSLLPADDRRELPEPDWSDSVTNSNPVADLGPGDQCGLCWVEPPREEVRFNGQLARACERCVELFDGRFPTTASIYNRCERILTDIRDLSESPHGISWLSPMESLNAPEKDVSLSPSGPPLEQVHLIRELARVSQTVGHPATQAEFRKHGSTAPRMVRDSFGSWDAALEAAGLGKHEE